MKFIDLFAGIGGFRLGLEKINEYGLENVATRKRNKQGVYEKGKGSSVNDSGNVAIQQFTCVYSNEWNKYAAQIYRKQFGNKVRKGSREAEEGNGGSGASIKSVQTSDEGSRPKRNTPKSNGGQEEFHYGECDTRDITTVHASEIPDFDLLCAGFPCQSFSVAGKRKGFEDTRGTLFFEIARIAKHKRPRYLLLENVKGLLNHEQGKTFQTILGVLANLGYDCEWQVLNSKHFGVPQNRERVFIIGHLGKESGQQIFPIRETVGKNANKIREEQKGRSWVSTLDSRYGQRWSTETYVRTENMNGEGFNNPYTGTIRAGASRNNNIVNGIRRLTPTECERLQGFPDGWTEYGIDHIEGVNKMVEISDTQRYKCLGNAVTTNVITAIAEKLL